VVALALALIASVAWGASDFLGGLASRRLPIDVVLLGAQGVGLVLAAAVWWLSGARLPRTDVIAIAGGAGLAELLGFACLYRGLAIGEMTVAAPLAALTAVLPVAVSLAGGAPPAGAEVAGMGLAIAGSAVVAAAPGGGRCVARGAGMGLAAAVCFGLFFVLLGHAGESGGPAAVLLGRVASVGLLALALAARPAACAHPSASEAALIGALGALDVAANLAYAEAAVRGADATVAVLGSLYPLTTVLLARAVLRERLGRRRLAGIAAVLGGVALISASAT
jgi:drug/metabolite transporter (DMT)-like permease